ncbi:MAG TPA: SCO family protein [Pyrinomonadaceae bacterium]|nr:SCO family protein [Pyrinomonadaceae bacterium]
MKSMDRRSLLALLGAAPFAAGLVAKAATTTGTSGATTGSASIVLSPAAQRSRDKIRDRYFPNVLLTTHEGKKVRLYDDLIKDKIVLINFMYAKCEGVCPGITTNLVKVQKLLGPRVGRDIFMYSFTLKPEQDTPERMAEYAEMHGVRPGWLYLTGDVKEMETLRVKLGFTNPDPLLDKDVTQHIGNVRYGNEPLQQWGACPGLAKPSFIAESIGWVDWPTAEKGVRK